jgi:hypothetical protein
METIKSYDLHDAFKINAFTKISMPKDAQILKVDSVRNIVTVFAVVDTEQDTNLEREFCLLPTGGAMSSMYMTPVYLGTVQLNNGTLVLHIFELVKENLNGTETDAETAAESN